jgi:hypothetical protein
MVELFEILEQLLDALVIVHEHVDRIPLSATLRAGHGVSFLAGRCTKHQRYRSMLPRSSHGGAAGRRKIACVCNACTEGFTGTFDA